MSVSNSCSLDNCVLKSGPRPAIRDYVAFLLVLLGGLSNLFGEPTVVVLEEEDPAYSLENFSGEYGEFADVALALLGGRKETGKETGKEGKLKVKPVVDKSLKDLLKLASDGTGFDSYEDLARTISLAASRKASLDGDTYEVLAAYEVAARLDPLADEIVREYEYRKLRYDSLVNRVESAKARKAKEGEAKK